MEDNRYGKDYGEVWHLFMKSEDDNVPIFVENIGQTFPNSQIYIERDKQNIFVIEYIISGKERLKVNGKEYVLEAGDLCILEPEIPHSYGSDKKEPVRKKWINFSSDIFKTMYEKMGLSGRIIYKNADCEQLFDLLLTIAETSVYSDDICYDVAPHLFNLIFNLAKNINFESKKPISKLAFSIKEKLDKNIYTNKTLDEILDDVFYSKKQITREFRKYYNDTPYNYLINNKIKIAKYLLKTTKLSVKEIATRLGFENQHYFSNAFKKKTGSSPSLYRNKYIIQ